MDGPTAFHTPLLPEVVQEILVMQLYILISIRITLGLALAQMHGQDARKLLDPLSHAPHQDKRQAECRDCSFGAWTNTHWSLDRAASEQLGWHISPRNQRRIRTMVPILLYISSCSENQVQQWKIDYGAIYTLLSQAGEIRGLSAPWIYTTNTVE